MSGAITCAVFPVGNGRRLRGWHHDRRHADLGIHQLLEKLETQAGQCQDDMKPKDDITFLGLEVLA